MIKTRNEMLEDSIRSNYKEDFEHLISVVEQRSLKGFYDTKIDYSTGYPNCEMVRVFHNYLILKGYTVYTGTINKFPFISIHWD